MRRAESRLPLSRQFKCIAAADRLWARRGRWIDDSTYRIETQNMESAIVAEWTARPARWGLELLYADGYRETVTMRAAGTGTEKSPAAAPAGALPAPQLTEAFPEFPIGVSTLTLEQRG